MGELSSLTVQNQTLCLIFFLFGSTYSIIKKYPILILYASRAGDYYARVMGTTENEALFVMERTTWIREEPITTVKAVTFPGYQLQTQI